MLAGTMKAVISQRLVRTVEHSGRVAVCEILRMTGRAHDMILDPDETDRLREVIAEGEYYGMQTFDQALLRHYQAGRVSMDDALHAATSPHDFKLLVAGDGRTATSMEDVGGGATERRAEAPAPRRPTPAVAAGGPARNGSAPPPGVPA
jgi:twitching motility protein PilT